MLPNFLIAGGVATGTSFLSATLTKHPDIYLPRIQRPEPNFFHYSFKFNRGLDWYQQTWFSEIRSEKAIGERSSLMMPSEVAPIRLKKVIPEVKLIFCLRNPIERAWGNYRFTVLEGLESLSFEEAIETEPARMSAAEGMWSEVQPHAYVARGRYAKNLTTYVELFGRENILFLKSEEIGKNPDANVEAVLRFLGVDSNFKLEYPPNYSSPSVADKLVQSHMRSYFGDRFPELIEAIRRDEDLGSFVKTAQDATNVEDLRANLLYRKEPMPEEARKKLQEIYSPELSELQAIVPFSIEDWK